MSNLLSERLAVVGVVDPDNYASGSQSTDVIDMKYHDRVMFIISVGQFDNGGAGSADFKVLEATATGGTFKGLSGKSITQMTEAGSTDDDDQKIINVYASELSAGYRYIKGNLKITGAQNVDAAVISMADSTRFSDAVTSTSFGDLASVSEIVA
jgi:hypothetical protein